MNTEYLHRLASVDGPFSSIYFADPGQTVSASEREAYWRDQARELIDLGTPEVHIEHADSAVLDGTPPEGRVGRVIVTNDQQTWLDQYLRHVPDVTTARCSRLPHLLPLVEFERPACGPRSTSDSSRWVQGLSEVCAAMRCGAVGTLAIGELGDQPVYVGDMPNWIATDAGVLFQLGSVTAVEELAVDALPYAAVAITSDIVRLGAETHAEDGCAALVRSQPEVEAEASDGRRPAPL